MRGGGKAAGARSLEGHLPFTMRRIKLFLAAGISLGSVAAWGEPPYPRLEELVEVVDLSSVAASPDGRQVAFRTDRPSIAANNYDLAWHVVDLATGAVHDLGSAGESNVAEPGLLVAEPPIWSPDGRWIYYRALRSGAVQIWRTAVDGSGSAAVTAEDGDVVTVRRSRDGRSISYRVGPAREEIERAELEEYRNGILVDEHVELGQNVFHGAMINGRLATQRLTGRWFARGGLLFSRPLRGPRLDFETLAISQTEREEVPPAGTSAAAAAPDTIATSGGGDVATSIWDGAQSVTKVVRAVAGGQISCAAPACRTRRVIWLAWRPEQDQLVFASTDRAHVQSLYLWNVSSNRVRPIATSDGLLNGGRLNAAPCAIVRNQAVCVAAGPASPPRLEMVALTGGRRHVLFDPNPILRARRWPVAERLEWRSAEGLTFTGTLFRPDSPTGALPLFINYYRCEGFLRGGEGDEWPLASLAEGGIASVCINATPMTGPQDAVAQYRAAFGGVEALVDLLASRGMIDRARVGMGGLSFGSEVTMWTVMHSNLIAAASVASPQFEPSNYWFNGVRGRDHHQILRQAWGLGTPEETPDRWRLISPALNVDHIHAPLLLQLPEQESRYAVELYARLSNSTTPTELYVFPDEAHIKAQPQHRLAVYQRNLDWFRFWLQNYVDDDPRKMDQYRHWRLLAERFRPFVTSAPSAATVPATQDRTP